MKNNSLINKTDNELLKVIDNDTEEIRKDAYNIRKNSSTIETKSTANIKIMSKKDKPGIDIYVKDNTEFGIINIPVIVTESGIDDKVYNDFYIGKNANVYIVAGCGICNLKNKDSKHSGIHRFFLEEGSKVKYIEKHYGTGSGKGKRILNPETEFYLKENSTLEMDTSQIKGVDSTIRKTSGKILDNATLIIKEKIMTHGKQLAESSFDIKLEGENASSKVTSRSVATENSIQKFKSVVYGNAKCFSHTECDAIIKDNAKVNAEPKIVANNVDANLIHEAAIGKIAGEQLIKLMTLGLSKKEAEEEIIKGFLN